MYLQRCVTTTFVQGHQIFLIRQGNCHSLPQSFSTPAHTLDLASPGKWLYSLITLYHYWHFTPFDLVFTCLSTDGCKTCLHLGEHELFSFEHWCVGIWIIVFIFFWHELRSGHARSHGTSICDSFKDWFSHWRQHFVLRGQNATIYYCKWSLTIKDRENCCVWNSVLHETVLWPATWDKWQTGQTNG